MNDKRPDVTDEFSIVIGSGTAVLKFPVRVAKSHCFRHLKRKGQDGPATNRSDPNESTDWYHRFYHGDDARSTECSKWLDFPDSRSATVKRSGPLFHHRRDTL